MDKVFVTKGVADTLFATEAAIDAAQLQAAELMTTLVQARTTLEMSATVGSAEIAAVTAAVGKLDAARQELVTAHLGLSGVAKRARLRAPAAFYKDYPGDKALAEYDSATA